MFLTMAIGFGGTATVWADEPTKPSDGSDQGVQERAVPGMRIPGVSSRRHTRPETRRRDNPGKQAHGCARVRAAKGTEQHSICKARR